MKSLELVVARYAEDLAWLRRVPKRMKVTVYDKGAEPAVVPPRRNLSVVRMPALGREEYSYLHHIIQHYDELADYTVFAQGKPFDHVPSFHRHLQDLAFQRMEVNDFCWLGFIIDEEDADGSLFLNWSKNPYRDPLPLREFWAVLWNESPPNRIVFYPSSHFIVSADAIRCRSVAFYENALDVSANLVHAGHCFERVWDRIFEVDGIPPQHRNTERPTYLRNIRRLKT